MNQLSNLHEVVSESAQEPKKLEESPNLCVVSTKLSTEALDELKKITKANGTTVSAFLRQCCHKVIEEYTA